VVSTQRDWGNRSNRRNAKTKYTLDRVGVETFKAEVERRARLSFQPVSPYHFSGRGDHIGWISGVDGKHHLTLFIPSGRLIDSPGKPLKSGVAAIARIHQGDFRLTPNQNLIIAGVSPDQKADIDAIARQHGLIDDDVSAQRKSSMACVSFPTCPLAMAEAERVLPGIVDALDIILARHHLSDDAIIFRVTGCPNGCGRAMLAEIGLVGRAVGRYALYLGGNKQGTRIPRLYRDNLPLAEILTLLESLIADWSAYRLPAEDFGDFVIRHHVVKPVLNSSVDFHQQDEKTV